MTYKQEERAAYKKKLQTHTTIIIGGIERELNNMIEIASFNIMNKFGLSEAERRKLEREMLEYFYPRN